MLNLKFLTMSYIRGGSDYSMIQSQAAMLKLMHENEHKYKELLKRSLAALSIIPPDKRFEGDGLNDLINDLTKALTA